MTSNTALLPVPSDVAVPGCTRLFVGGVPDGVDEAALTRRLRMVPGVEVDLAAIVRHQNTGASKGFAYVNVKGDAFSAPVASVVSVFNGTKWQGQRLRVQVAREHYLAKLHREHAAAALPPAQRRAAEDAHKALQGRLRHVGTRPLQGDTDAVGNGRNTGGGADRVHAGFDTDTDSDGDGDGGQAAGSGPSGRGGQVAGASRVSAAVAAARSAAPAWFLGGMGGGDGSEEGASDFSDALSYGVGDDADDNDDDAPHHDVGDGHDAAAVVSGGVQRDGSDGGTTRAAAVVSPAKHVRFARDGTVEDPDAAPDAVNLLDLDSGSDGDEDDAGGADTDDGTDTDTNDGASKRDEAAAQHQFRVRPQFEGEAGQKLLELQRRVGSDDRFRIDERFAVGTAAADGDDDQRGGGNDDQRASDADDVAQQLASEKSRGLDILAAMMGVDSGAAAVPPSAPSRTTTPASRPGPASRGRSAYVPVSSSRRYDPTAADAARFELGPVQPPAAAPPAPRKRREPAASTLRPAPDLSGRQRTFEVAVSSWQGMLNAAHTSGDTGFKLLGDDSGGGNDSADPSSVVAALAVLAPPPAAAAAGDGAPKKGKDKRSGKRREPAAAPRAMSADPVTAAARFFAGGGAAASSGAEAAAPASSGAAGEGAARGANAAGGGSDGPATGGGVGGFGGGAGTDDWRQRRQRLAVDFRRKFRDAQRTNLKRRRR